MRLNRGRVPLNSDQRIPGPRWLHERSYGLKPGEESSELPCSAACLVASDEMLRGRQQAGAHGFMVIGDSAELAMITAQPLEERSRIINLVGLENDLHQRIDEVPALRRHRGWEQLSHLRMLDEQAGVEEQR